VAERIETLYLATVNRKPRPDETSRLLKYVSRGAPAEITVKSLAEAFKSAVTKGGSKQATTANQALADILWALLNSSEFILNH
jgi:hypothetical protein